MSRVAVQAFVTLDGVVQGGGAPDEDREGEFEHRGWALDFDSAHGADADQVVAEWESRTEALLLGRKTDDIFARSRGVWDEAGDGLQGEFTRRYNRIPKYVASRTLAEHDLIDEYRLIVYPLVLGTGKKLFNDGFPLTGLELAETRPLPSGLVVTIYRRRDAR